VSGKHNQAKGLFKHQIVFENELMPNNKGNICRKQLAKLDIPKKGSIEYHAGRKMRVVGYSNPFRDVSGHRPMRFIYLADFETGVENFDDFVILVS